MAQNSRCQAGGLPDKGAFNRIISRPQKGKDIDITAQEMEICLDVLQRLVDSHGNLERSQRLNSLIYKLYREGRRRERQRSDRELQKSQDRELLAATTMVQTQQDQSLSVALPAPSGRRLHEPITCYICKELFHEVHSFYHLLCPGCAAFNYEMRSLSADLRGRTALVTGGRVKIGFQTVLRLLRDGARVIVTTRFPQAAARRFQAEDDLGQWQHRLHLYGLDLRNLPAVERFAEHLLEHESALDIVIHNAAQTIRRPEGFYRELLEQERHPLGALAGMVVQAGPSELALAQAVGDVLPLDRLHDREELADSRHVNSWLLRLNEVSAGEMLEVQLVNSVAPFLLNSRLKPLLMRSPRARRFIVNVSAVEGQFARNKTVFHPHTNMAKAALNMMTRTSGADYANDNIFMTSVDTGWVTDENPTPKRRRNQEELGFYAPLDIVDGMARIYHPVAFGILKEEQPYFGVFLKDYAPCPW
jgi:NAD(P)-dependent dehydrogenase (short-subunit alcohol dehydrogenase family)